MGRKWQNWARSQRLSLMLQKIIIVETVHCVFFENVHPYLTMVMHAFNSSTWVAEACASLVYKLGSRAAKAAQRKPVSKPPTEQS